MPLSQAPIATIRTAADVATGAAALAQACPHMAAALERHGLPDPRTAPTGFPGLAQIVVGQQVSVASAAAIWSRFEAIVQPLEPATFLGLDATERAQIGLSAPKKRTLDRLCNAILQGAFDPDSLTVLPDAEVVQRVMALSGFGPWSADIYLMFSLGRADAFAAGDLALQAAAGDLLDLPERPDAARLAAIAERWRPWRSVAALILWRHYSRALRPRSGAPLSDGAT